MRKMHSRRGQSAVEFGLTIPVLMLLVLGIVDFGRVLSASSTLAHATREGARYGSLNWNRPACPPSPCLRQTVIDEAGRGSVTVSASQVDVIILDSSSTDCNSVSLTAPCALTQALAGAGTYTAVSPCPRATAPGCAAALVGDLIQVKTTVPWSAQTLIIQGVMPSTFAIKASTAATIEQ